MRPIVFSLGLIASVLSVNATPAQSGADIIPRYDELNPQRVLLSPPQIEAELATLPGWTAHDGKITKTYVCADFPSAIAFLVRLGYACEKLDHHPEIFTVYSKVQISCTTYDAGQKISTFDIALARAIEAAAPPLKAKP